MSKTVKTTPNVLKAPPGWQPQPVANPKPPPFTAQERLDMKVLNYKLPAPVKIHVTLFEVPSNTGERADVADRLKAAEQLFKAHNLVLTIYPEDKTPLLINYPLDAGGLWTAEQVADIRRLAHGLHDDKANPMRCPVIFAPFHASLKSQADGVTQVDYNNKPDGQVVVHGNTTWLPFAFVDSPDKRLSTFVHEVCHCAMVEHESAGGVTTNIMHFGENGLKATINKHQVRQLARCYFAQPKTKVP
jgi:hypothetical protein